METPSGGEKRPLTACYSSRGHFEQQARGPERLSAFFPSCHAWEFIGREHNSAAGVSSAKIFVCRSLGQERMSLYLATWLGFVFHLLLFLCHWSSRGRGTYPLTLERGSQLPQPLLHPHPQGYNWIASCRLKPLLPCASITMDSSRRGTDWRHLHHHPRSCGPTSCSLQMRTVALWIWMQWQQQAPMCSL